MSTRYRSGDWNAICDRCGRKYKASKLHLEQKTNLRVCKPCLDPLHPSDYFRGRADDQSVPWTRPESSTDQYVAGSQFGVYATLSNIVLGYDGIGSGQYIYTNDEYGGPYTEYDTGLAHRWRDGGWFDGLHVLVGSSSQIHTSDDDGVTWTQATINYANPSHEFLDFKSVAVDSNGRIAVAYPKFYMYYSDDNGLTWDYLPYNATLSTFMVDIKYATGPGKWLMAADARALPGEYNVLWSDDLVTWECAVLGTYNPMTCVEYDSNWDNIIVGGVNGYCRYSESFGGSWGAPNFSPALSSHINDLLFFKNSMYLASDAGLYVSSDGGKNFIRHEYFGNNAIQRLGHSPIHDVIMAGDSYSNLYVSEQGSTWIKYDDVIPYAGSLVRVIAAN